MDANLNEHDAAPSAGDLALLARVKDYEVTFRSNISGRISYRAWSSETQYVTCTKAAKRLDARGWIKCWHNPSSFGKGGVELTAAGIAALAHSDELSGA